MSETSKYDMLLRTLNLGAMILVDPRHRQVYIEAYEAIETLEKELAAANERINLATEIMKKCTPTDDWNLPLERLCEIVQEGYWKLDAETAELEIKLTAANERLENNHYYDAQGVRHECEPGTFPDGIACRDEKIKLLKERIKELEAQLAAARGEK